MGFYAKILKDSVSTVPGQQARLTTMELSMPRVVAAEPNQIGREY